jgi:hypothetical protein
MGACFSAVSVVWEALNSMHAEASNCAIHCDCCRRDDSSEEEVQYNTTRPLSYGSGARWAIKLMNRCCTTSGALCETRQSLAAQRVIHIVSGHTDGFPSGQE